MSRLAPGAIGRITIRGTGAARTGGATRCEVTAGFENLAAACRTIEETIENAASAKPA
jgi:hypothetical protein